MVMTRSASSSPVKKQTSQLPSSTTSTTSTNIQRPTRTEATTLQLVIAPENLSSSARFIRLPDPTDNRPKQYLFCSQAGTFELKRVNVPKHDPRSILFAPGDNSSGSTRTEHAVSNGYINRNAEYVTATPYDLSFALLPIVTEVSNCKLFKELDDLLEENGVDGYDLRYILQQRRDLLERAAESICDSVEAGDEKMYRYNQEKTLQLIIAKAKRACTNGLPASLEERFVTRLLESPVLSIKREESTISVVRQESQDTLEGTPVPSSESFDTQSSAASATPSVVFSETSAISTITAATIAEESTPSDIKYLQRLLTAFRFIAASYLPPQLSTSLLAALQQPSSGIDFTPLTTHLTHLCKLRAEAAASIADISSFSRKRGSLEDDEDAEMRAEKKLKLEEEEKRKKANTSRGVKDLAKVDVKGMKKMSSFFTKMPAKGKT